jgi:hypothetical protein
MRPSHTAIQKILSYIPNWLGWVLLIALITGIALKQCNKPEPTPIEKHEDKRQEKINKIEKDLDTIAVDTPSFLDALRELGWE